VPLLHAYVGDRASAEDLAQEVLAIAQREWAKVSAYDRPSAWLRRVALNRASNVRRHQRRETLALGRLDHDAPATHESVTDDRLWAVVRQLPDQQRRAVVLHYVEDLPIAEVALVLGCSASSIKTHLGRARSAMARQLGEPREEVTR